MFKFLFPKDWTDVERHDVHLYSQFNGSDEGIMKIIVIQKSPSTGRYRKQIINVKI